MIEIKIMVEGLNGLAEAIRELAVHMHGQKNTDAQQTGVWQPQGAVQNPAPAFGAPALQGQASSPVQAFGSPAPQGHASGPASAFGTPTSQGAVMQPSVPITASAQEYTIEQLQVAAAGLTSSGKMPQVMGILQNFGIRAMTELRKEQYSAFAGALREAGAQI